MSKLLFLGNFAWSYSVYRKLESTFTNKFDEVEIWIAKIPTYKSSPFLNESYKLANSNIKVMSKQQLRLQHQYTGVDVLIACGFPYLIPIEFLTLENVLAINLHPSLLPKFWGPDPIRNQIVRNDNLYGVSLQLLGKNYDTGAVLEQSELEVVNEGCIYEILFDLSFVAATLVEKFLSQKEDEEYKKLFLSHDCPLSEDYYAGAIEIESYQDEPHTLMRLTGSGAWLGKLLHVDR